jgi:hypothetical protein
MKRWTLDEISWDSFDATKVRTDVLAVAKAAAIVERNAGDYVTYLRNVFADDHEFSEAAKVWGAEEIQHGEALARWARLADPAFDFERSLRAFVDGYRLPLTAKDSIRGSRTAELIARCVVESGTSSYYSALADAVEEPVLREICRRIAGDEFRHYRMFYDHLQRYLARERPWLLRRALVALQRYRETDDDELAFAYHCANHLGRPYDRKRASSDYFHRAFAFYRPNHIHRAVTMMAKAAGLDPRGTIVELASRLAWGYTQRQIRQRATA